MVTALLNGAWESLLLNMTYSCVIRIACYELLQINIARTWVAEVEAKNWG